jgi:hypothetical protein
VEEKLRNDDQGKEMNRADADRAQLSVPNNNLPCYSIEGLIRLIQFDLGLMDENIPIEEFSSELEGCEFNVAREKLFEPLSKKCGIEVREDDEIDAKIIEDEEGTECSEQVMRTKVTDDIDKVIEEECFRECSEQVMRTKVTDDIDKVIEEECFRECSEPETKVTDDFDMEIKEDKNVLEFEEKRIPKVQPKYPKARSREFLGKSEQEQKQTEDVEEIKDNGETENISRMEKSKVTLILCRLRCMKEQLKSFVSLVGASLIDDADKSTHSDSNTEEVKRLLDKKRKTSIINVWIRTIISSNLMFTF